MDDKRQTTDRDTNQSMKIGHTHMHISETMLKQTEARKISVGHAIQNFFLSV